MKEREITINGKIVKLKEIKYKDATSFVDLTKEESAKKLMLISTDLTEDDYENLTMSDGTELMKEINELNGLVDFPNPIKLETS